ncbi:MAB_1171c family putative transporter [Streptomyces fragilis]|uniref:MAB_1171c family putative transporter n=1 Tax=Streptomyces fragilis TaxID=67301 RepID=A0ABV2YIX3_9ACTN|nr:MAB_1171c family putative transporter [Streptomyces fragilis]
MESWIFYGAAAVLLAGVAAQWPGVRALRQDPLRRSIASVALLGSCCFALAAPPTIAVINRITSVPNAAAPLTYSAMMAFSAASLSLMIRWYGGSTHRARRAIRACGTAYVAVAVALFSLFAAGEAPVARPTDFDTYYSTTPAIRELIVLYLSAHLAAASTTCVLCVKWSRAAGGWVRGSLLFLAVGWASVTGYSVCKLIAVSGRWSGHAWDALSTQVAPSLVAAGAGFVMMGYVLPALGRRLDSLRVARALGPLYRLVVADGGRCAVRLGGISALDVNLHLARRVSAIHDALHRLGDHLDDRVRSRVHQELCEAGLDPRRAEIFAAAAMVTHATRPDREVVPAGHRGSVPLEEPALVQLSEAVRATLIIRAFPARPVAPVTALSGDALRDVFLK